MRILLVEDEPDLAHWLARTLARQSGMVVEWADDGLLADSRLSGEEFDAVVLDLGLPGMDGHGVLERMRGRDDRTPVLVLTARDSLGERVGTLKGGADDFLSKPFMVEELEARLQALVRRSRGRGHPRLSCGPLHLDVGAQRFFVLARPGDKAGLLGLAAPARPPAPAGGAGGGACSAQGETLALSPREHAVLRALIQRSGEPIAKQQILERVFTGDSEVNLEVIEVLVHRLRKKLVGTGVQIVTLRGLGYCLEEEGPPALEAGAGSPAAGSARH